MAKIGYVRIEHSGDVVHLQVWKDKPPMTNGIPDADIKGDGYQASVTDHGLKSVHEDTFKYIADMFNRFIDTVE